MVLRLLLLQGLRLWLLGLLRRWLLLQLLLRFLLLLPQVGDLADDDGLLLLEQLIFI